MRSWNKALKAGLFVLLLLLWGPPAYADTVQKLQVEGVTRFFVEHVPAGIRDPVPLLLVFHGFGGSAYAVAKGFGFDRLSDRQGFIVAYPQGIARRWNAALSDKQPDDVAFVVALIQAVETSNPISKVYATGFSNGGMFANSLACSGRVHLSAIAADSGFIPDNLKDLCRVARPVSVLEIAATEDPVMPFRGGNVWVLPPPGKFVLSYQESLAVWARVDDCAMLAPGARRGDGFILDVGKSCGAGKSVQGIAVNSTVHSWSGKAANYPINTSQVVLSFLLSH